MNIEKALAPSVHWKQAYPAVAEAARSVLAALKPGERLSTRDLANAIYSGPDKATLQRVFKALKAMSHNELADLWEPAVTLSSWYGTLKLWHRPRQ